MNKYKIIQEITRVLLDTASSRFKHLSVLASLRILMILVHFKLILLVFSFAPWLQPVGACFISGHFLPQSLSQDRSFLRRKTKGKDTKERLVWLPKSYTAHFNTFCSTENSLCLQPFQTLELSVFTFRHTSWIFGDLKAFTWRLGFAPFMPLMSVRSKVSRLPHSGTAAAFLEL
jgi:hypothetical protein